MRRRWKVPKRCSTGSSSTTLVFALTAGCVRAVTDDEYAQGGALGRRGRLTTMATDVKAADSPAQRARRRKPAAAEHQALAFRLRADKGLSFTEIGAAMGISRSGAFDAFNREMAAVRELVSEDEVREAVILQCARLDSALQVAATIAASSPEPDVRLRAVDRIIRIEERRARLLGLDKPQRAVLGVVVDTQGMTAEQEAEELAAWTGAGDPTGAQAIAQGPSAVLAPVEPDV